MELLIKAKTLAAIRPLGASLPTKEKENAKLKVKECLKELDSFKQCALL